MVIILHIYLFIIGLVLGSFFNVVGLRVPKGESIVSPPSHCTNCKRKLTFFDLIPVFSYLFLKGKCRSCHTKISLLYPIIEFATACLFTISPLMMGWSKELLITFPFISLLMIIFVSDIVYMIIPNKVLLFFGVYFVIIRIIIPTDPWWSSIAGAILGFAILFLIAVISKGGMGGGDIKLFALLGVVIGYKLIFVTLFLATLFGAVIGIIGMILGKVRKKEPIPFGPFIVLAALITYFYGTELVTWYLALL